MYTGDPIVSTIYMSNWVVDSTGILVHELDHMTSILKVITDAPSDYKFKLEVRSETGRKDIVDVDRSGEVLTIMITNSAFPKEGIYSLQLRGNIVVGGEVKTRHSSVFHMRVRDSIGAASYFAGQHHHHHPHAPHPPHHPHSDFCFPTEFIQLENRLAEMRNQAIHAAERSEAALEQLKSLISGDLSSDKCCTHVQDVPAALWTINHCLKKMPSVTVISEAGEVVFGEIIYIDDENLTIQFTDAIAGKAYLN